LIWISGWGFTAGLSKSDHEGRAGGFRGRVDRPVRSLPKEVNTLMLIVRIKAMCKRAGISKLDAGPKGATIQFHKDKFANPAGLVDFLKAQGPAARVNGNKIVLAGRDEDRGRPDQGRVQHRP
jgi:transcription-repair coupling factor (superfamily II helicase)